MHLNNSICKSREEKEEKRKEKGRKKPNLCSKPINNLREREAGNAGWDGPSPLSMSLH